MFFLNSAQFFNRCWSNFRFERNCEGVEILKKAIRNLVLRQKIYETLLVHLAEKDLNGDEVNDLLMDIELEVMMWIAEEKLKPSDA